MPFLVCEIFKNDLFAIDINGNIWRFTLEYVDQQVCIQKLLGNEPAYYSIIKLLKVKRDLLYL